MSEPVRVLQIVAAMDRGGIENFIMNVYRKIDRSLLQFDFLYHTAAPCAFDEEILAMGGRIYRFPMSQGVDFVGYCRFLDAFFAEHKEYKVCHGHYSMFGVFYNHYAQKHGVKIRVAHSHNTKASGEGLNRLADDVLSRMSSWGATKCFACSTDAGVFLFNKKDFEVCKNGIHCDRFIYSEALRKHIRNQYGIAEQTCVIGSVGQFRKQKNYAWLSKPLADLVMRGEDVRLLLVGDGECREEIERAFTEAGVLDKVIFAGVQADTAPFYSAMDVFVLPSLFEGLGIVAVEAQANGLPCILSEGVPSETALGNSVRYLPLDNPEKWADALAGTPQRSANGGEIVRAAGYDISATAAKLQEFYLQAYSE